MAFSLENENFLKVSYICLDIIPKYLRPFFIKCWDAKYPEVMWQSNAESGSVLISHLSDAFKRERRNWDYVRKMKTGNEQTWDVITLGKLFLYCNLGLVQDDNIRNGIKVLCDVRNNDFGHQSSASISSEKLAEVIKNVNTALTSVLGEDIEVDRVVSSKSSQEIAGTMRQHTRNDESHGKSEISAMVKALRELFDDKASRTKPCTKEVIDKIKERYMTKYEKHSILTVSGKSKIEKDEQKIEGFAVTLMISPDSPSYDELANERKRHIECLRNVTGECVEIDKFIDKSNRVTFIRGAAGMGKSVLAKRLVYGWARNDIYTEFKLCIIIECRNLNYFKSHNGKDLDKDRIIGEYLKTEVGCDLGDGKDILFVVDGFDELTDMHDKSIIWQILDNRHSTYAMSKIIVLGRPHVEDILVSHEVGGLRKLEIIGLSEDQINAFITKSSLHQSHISLIKKAMPSPEKYLPILHVPQFLNTFCCVAILSKGETIQNPAELYCWTIGLLLLEHAEEEVDIKTIPDVFTKYSMPLLALSEMCYDLLKNNTIILEEDITKRLSNIMFGKDFVESLFQDVSDNFDKRYQFTHLSLMEFLSALHICNAKNWLEIIKDRWKEKLSEDILFVCRLMAGYSSSRIIQALLRKVVKSDICDDTHFLQNLLHKLHECKLNEEKTFRYSIQILVYFLNKNLTKTDDLKSIIKELHCRNFEPNVTDANNLMAICEHLLKECGYKEDEIEHEFESLSFKSFSVNKADHIGYLKLFNIVAGIKLLGIQLNSGTVQEFREDILKDCDWVEIANCKFKDEIYDKSVSTCLLDNLRIINCTLNLSIFKTLCEWALSCKIFELWNNAIEDEWWHVLASAIEKMRADGELQLHTLKLKQLPNKITKDVQRRILACGVALTINEKEVNATNGMGMEAASNDYASPLSTDTTNCIKASSLQNNDCSTESKHLQPGVKKDDVISHDNTSTITQDTETSVEMDVIVEEYASTQPSEYATCAKQSALGEDRNSTQFIDLKSCDPAEASQEITTSTVPTDTTNCIEASSLQNKDCSTESEGSTSDVQNGVSSQEATSVVTKDIDTSGRPLQSTEKRSITATCLYRIYSMLRYFIIFYGILWCFMIFYSSLLHFLVFYNIL